MPWNKGLTKETHPSLMKTSQTMKRKRIDNFAKWRKKMKRLGKIPANYHLLRPSKYVAEYIGVVLGDGNIGKFPRTERILISGNSNNPGFIKRYTEFTKRLFGKEPTVAKVFGKNAVRISLYQKEISRRLGVPCGNRQKLKINIPTWIWNNRNFRIKLLRGLFEAEGSLSIHKPTYTYNFAFSNTNRSLLETVERFLRELEFHPEVRHNAVRVQRRLEVERLRRLIAFRKY